MYVSVIIWTLQKGKTHDDFVRAWYPDDDPHLPSLFHTAINVSNPREIVAVGLHDTDMSRDDLAKMLLQSAARESARNRRIAEVVEASSPGRFFEVQGTFDMSTAEAFIQNRPT